MQSGRTILVVEDDLNSRDKVIKALNAQNHTTVEASSGSEGIIKFHETNPDLVILDASVPEVNGFDVCRKLRQDGARCPIVLISDKADTIDVVVGLELGADDYVTKPFEIRELMARIGAQLRRSEMAAAQAIPQIIEHNGLKIDLGRRLVTVNGVEKNLTLTEFNLLTLLATRKGQVMSRGELLRRVWGYEVDIETRTVDAHVYRLRRKIEPVPEDPTYVLSVPGIGYRFAD